MKKAVAVEIQAVKELLSDIRSIEENMLILGVKEQKPGELHLKLNKAAKEAIDYLNEKLA